MPSLVLDRLGWFVGTCRLDGVGDAVWDELWLSAILDPFHGLLVRGVIVAPIHLWLE